MVLELINMQVWVTAEWVLGMVLDIRMDILAA
jgi:hypothetical protein